MLLKFGWKSDLLHIVRVLVDHNLYGSVNLLIMLWYDYFICRNEMIYHLPILKLLTYIVMIVIV